MPQSEFDKLLEIFGNDPDAQDASTMLESFWPDTSLDKGDRQYILNVSESEGLVQLYQDQRGVKTLMGQFRFAPVARMVTIQVVFEKIKKGMIQVFMGAPRVG